MSYKPVKRLCVAGDTYTDQNGQEKTKWVEIGVIMQRTEDKKLSVVLDAGINLAAFTDGGQNPRSVWVNVFELNSKSNNAPKPEENREDVPF